MENYMPYCQAGKLFYDRPSAGSAKTFAAATRAFPEEWDVVSDGYWTHVTRHGGSVREQGWKIHVSVVPESAEEVIEIVVDYCLERRVDFKFLTSPRTHASLNSKNASRGSSGKLITMYPADDDAARTSSVICAGATGRFTSASAVSARCTAPGRTAGRCWRSAGPTARSFPIGGNLSSSSPTGCPSPLWSPR
jgi:hypothetical protein